MRFIHTRGVICQEGIIVEGEAYSCSEAIRGQWFINGGGETIEVDVIIDREDRSELFVLISDKVVRCLQVTKELHISEEELAQYYKNIQKLKQHIGHLLN